MSGEADLRRNYALDDGELARGFVLTCQTYPVGAEVAIEMFNAAGGVDGRPVAAVTADSQSKADVAIN